MSVGPLIGAIGLTTGLSFIKYKDPGSASIANQTINVSLLGTSLLLAQYKGYNPIFLNFFLIILVLNIIARSIYKATDRDENGTVSRWDAVSITLSYFIMCWGVFYASNLNSLNFKSRYSSYFAKSVHIGAFLGISLTAYPLATLLPNIGNLPPPGFNKSQSVMLCDNSEYVTHMRPPPQETGLYVGARTTFFDWGEPYSSMYSGTITDPQNPVYIVDVPQYARCMIYLTIDRKTLVVQFGGTMGTQNVITDITFIDQTWTIGGETVNLHKGFYDCYMSIATPVLANVKSLVTASPQLEKIVIAGHSLGGALATISALSLQFSDLDYKWKPSMEVFTIGSPQVGSRNFVNLFNRTINVSIRAANPIDMIPRLLDGVLYHVKGFLPTLTFYTKVGQAHHASTYSNAITNWSLKRVVFFTALPFLIGAGAIVIMYFIIKNGAIIYSRKSLLPPGETPTFVQKLTKLLNFRKSPTPLFSSHIPFVGNSTS
jgi:hypothetical protein